LANFRGRQQASWNGRGQEAIWVPVMVMVFIAAAFFFVVDQAFSAGVRLVFGLGQ